MGRNAYLSGELSRRLLDLLIQDRSPQDIARELGVTQQELADMLDRIAAELPGVLDGEPEEDPGMIPEPGPTIH